MDSVILVYDANGKANGEFLGFVSKELYSNPYGDYHLVTDCNGAAVNIEYHADDSGLVDPVRSAFSTVAVIRKSHGIAS